MTAPSATARVEASGILLEDGFSSLITFAGDPNLSLWEKTVQPPGIEGGDAIEISTMFNSTWRTFSARSLKTLTEHSLTAAYDPIVYDEIVSIINLETTVTVAWPDGSTLAFYGFLRNFEPQPMEEGSQPEANCSIVPTNWDPSARSEEAPVLTNVAGT